MKLYMPRMVPTLSAGCAKDASTEIIRGLCYQEMCKFFLYAQRIESISVMTISPTELCPLWWSVILFPLYVSVGGETVAIT